MRKESFASYLKSVSAESSGKPQAYARAMEVIEATFFSKALVSTTDIWDFITTENIDALYEVVLREQKNEDGIFKDYKPVSYWKDGYCSAALKEYKNFLLKVSSQSKNKIKQVEQLNLIPLGSMITNILPKPFLLLAGISGTGKTRFVREQARASADMFEGVSDEENYCLIPVRPDWHEPSDLLGYISRISTDGPRYVTTELLRFIVSAWKHTAQSVTADLVTYKPQEAVCPFWLCLDEMNLAPVEQYFADYLSILETRSWEGEGYTCAPLLKPSVIRQQLEEPGRQDLWENLGIAGVDPLSAGLREYFSKNGIPLPFNLIVAGTVNMDETTHGFSRKVIDRALTIDFGEFFPNDYDEFFNPQSRAKTLGFPILSHAGKGLLSDENETATVNFLKEVNAVLKGTPFELAYRALNEVLLAIACFNPSTPDELQAVWDDFLMMKVLPRIEGDAEKLSFQDETSLLTKLADALKTSLSVVWDVARPDLLREHTIEGALILTPCRSKRKIEWMQKRLADNGFTTFWP